MPLHPRVGCDSLAPPPPPDLNFVAEQAPTGILPSPFLKAFSARGHILQGRSSLAHRTAEMWAEGYRTRGDEHQLAQALTSSLCDMRHFFCPYTCTAGPRHLLSPSLHHRFCFAVSEAEPVSVEGDAKNTFCSLQSLLWQEQHFLCLKVFYCALRSLHGFLCGCQLAMLLYLSPSLSSSAVHCETGTSERKPVSCRLPYGGLAGSLLMGLSSIFLHEHLCSCLANLDSISSPPAAEPFGHHCPCPPPSLSYSGQ